MSDFGRIESYYEMGRAAKRAKEYEQAYRLYLACEITFQNGELPQYYPEYETMANNACNRKWKMMKKLPPEVQHKLRVEYAKAFGHLQVSELFLCGNWREFCKKQLPYEHTEQGIELPEWLKE